MLQAKNSKPGYDLESRTLKFARDTRNFVRKIPRTISNTEDGKQLIRSSGSVGANYIEANESLSRKDFIMRIKICRKEAKESSYWLNLIFNDDKPALDSERKELIQEAIELTKIFGSIVEKSK
jgi:four helix bundle protein